jgi:catechol 2,3-dioxygenase-like lactoylglutathione lyase family enzyme
MAFVLDMVGLVVKSIPESLKFYRVLGVDVEDPEEGEPYCEATLANGLRLSWNSVEMMKEIDPHWVEPVGQRVGIAFLCDGPSDVDARYQKLIDAGYRGAKEPWDAFWGQRYAMVLDPDGLSIDLFAPLG